MACICTHHVHNFLLPVLFCPLWVRDQEGLQKALRLWLGRSDSCLQRKEAALFLRAKRLMQRPCLLREQ